MKRFVLQQLIEWKNREDRKPLILNGARQVGKTWLLHEFASEFGCHSSQVQIESHG